MLTSGVSNDAAFLRARFTLRHSGENNNSEAALSLS
jgi:hypothetical protein